MFVSSVKHNTMQLRVLTSAIVIQKRNISRMVTRRRHFCLISLVWGTFTSFVRRFTFFINAYYILLRGNSVDMELAGSEMPN